MTRCVMKDGEECTDMQEIRNTVYGKYGLKSKVSWTAIGWIGGATFASFVGLIFWFSDIRTLAKEFPKEKEKTEQHSKDIVKLDERTNMILSSQNKTNELLQKLIDMKQNDNASNSYAGDTDKSVTVNTPATPIPYVLRDRVMSGSGKDVIMTGSGKDLIMK